MKNYKLPKISLVSFILSVISFALVIAIGNIYKKPELTIDLLILPVLFGLASMILSIVNLAKKGEKKKMSIVLIIISIIIVLAALFLLSLLRGLLMLT
ncbi:hypothetical protein [Candidatus Clostridium stratigraminis]|uniref:DUF4064 domain-containing protein n=1 Tax=Candidatus Clostridium stratigraminis TaxID=3381661 RepID=A0ABW8TAN5_9CLOT